MNKVSRYFCLVMAIIMLCSFSVYAEDDVESRASSYFRNYSAYLREVDTYNFAVVFRVTALRTMNELGVSTVKVQISSDGQNWATTQTYTKDSIPGFVDENTITHNYEFNYNGSRGYYYRAIIQLYAKDSTGTAKYSVYTPVIQLGS